MPRSTRANKDPVVSPNLGLYYNRARLDIPERALEDGYNFRIRNGVIFNRGIGWIAFGDGTWNLGHPVTLIDTFFPSDESEELIFGTTRDIFVWDPVAERPLLLTPRLFTGTASATAGSAVVTFSGVDLTVEGIKTGDRLHLGTSNQRDIMATWYEVQTVDSATQLTLTTTVPTDRPSVVYTIRKVFLGSVLSPWDADVFVKDSISGIDQWIATNSGVDWVISWDGVADQVTPHPEMGFRARTVASFANMMIYGAVSGSGGAFPTSIINSSIGQPFQAGDTGTGISEQFLVLGAQDTIINLVPLGDYLVIYGQQNIGLAHFVGDPLVFIFRTTIAGIGIPALGAIADFGDFHQILGADTGYRFDGTTIQEVNDHVWPAILAQGDPARRRSIYAHFDEENGELLWSIPRNDDIGDGDPFTTPPAQVFVEHYLEDVPDDVGAPFSRRDWPFTAAGYFYTTSSLAWQDLTVETWSEMVQAWGDQSQAALFPFTLVGDINGNLWRASTGQLTGAGAAMTSYVRFGRRVLGSGRERALLQRVYPWFRTATGNMNVTAYMMETGAQALPTPTVTIPFNQATITGNQFVSPFRRGRWFALEISTPPGVSFDFEGYDIDAVVGGMR